MITENASILKIHQLSKEQYERELAAGNIQKNELYLVPDESKVFTFTVTGEFGGTFSCDKTFAEIQKAYEKKCVIVANYLDISHVVTDITSNEIKFCFNYASVSGVFEYCIGIDKNDNVNLYYKYDIDIPLGDTFLVNETPYFCYNDAARDSKISALHTNNKTVVSAINELNAKYTEGTDALILLSPNGTRFSITVGDDGVLSATEITE